jgi:hypothetical protein
MKKLFGQRPKISKTPSSQASPIPTPVPAEQFARSAPTRGPSEDHWVVVQEQPPAGPGPFLQDRSRSSSFASLPPGAATFPTTTPSPNNATTYQHPSHGDPYSGTTHQSSQSLLQPNHNHNQVLKKKQALPVHGATAILRSLDPEQASLGGSTSPSLESLPLSGETERERDPRLAEREYEAERERERQREREREKDRQRDKERHRDRAREPERERDRGRERDRDRDKPKEKEKKKGLFSSGRDKDKEREKEGQAELTRMIGMSSLSSSKVEILNTHAPPKGYLTATASEDWALVLEVCERASANETAARDASKALRREFK